MAGQAPSSKGSIDRPSIGVCMGGTLQLKDVANAVRIPAEYINTPLHKLISQTTIVRSLPLILEHLQMHVIDFLLHDDRKALTFLSSMVGAEFSSSIV